MDLKALGFWVPRPTWTANDIPDLSGKVYIVTGANVGLASRRSLSPDWNRESHSLGVTPTRWDCLRCVSIEREGRCRDPRSQGGDGKDGYPVRRPSISVLTRSFLQLDLGSTAAAQQAGKEFAASHDRLDAVVGPLPMCIRSSQILSAGVMIPKPGSVTSDGLEMQFGTNAIGHFAFIKPVIPVLKKTASFLPPASVRMVWVSSAGVSPRQRLSSW